MFHVPEKYRIRSGLGASDARYGNNGRFIIPARTGRRELRIVASDGEGWEHVSVHAWSHRGGHAIPNWSEMCFVKDLFWDPEDVVMQLHPRASQYVNNHPYVLHLWRPTDVTIPEPPAILVGVVGLRPEEVQELRREIARAGRR